MRHLVISLALVLTAGCSTHFRQVTLAGAYLPSVDRGVAHHNSIDSIKSRYFTKDAYQAIKGIPTVVGITDTVYAAGSTRLSHLASFLTFNGVGRKVVITRSRLQNWGVGLLVHEYVHHLDNLDREGSGEFVDHEEFAKAYRRLMSDPKFVPLAREVRRCVKAYSWFFNRFLGIGPMSEEMAYVAAEMISEGVGPDYMWHALRKMLKHPGDR